MERKGTKTVPLSGQNGPHAESREFRHADKSFSNYEKELRGENRSTAPEHAAAAIDNHSYPEVSSTQPKRQRAALGRVVRVPQRVRKLARGADSTETCDSLVAAQRSIRATTTSSARISDDSDTVSSPDPVDCTMLEKCETAEIKVVSLETPGEAPTPPDPSPDDRPQDPAVGQ